MTARPMASRWLLPALLLLLMLTAGLLRLRDLAAIPHNIDHAYPVWQALHTLDTGALPLVGQQTSVLFGNPPLTGYLYLPVVALTRSPLGVYVFVITLNTLAVWLTYRAGRMLFRHPAQGVIAAWLVAVNPWIIEYSRTSWVQSLLPFLVTLVFWLALPVLLGRARHPVRRTALTLIAAAVLAHTYLLAFFIVVPLLALGLIYRRRVPLRGVLLGGSAFAGLGALYGLGLLSQWPQVSARLGDFSSGASAWSDEALWAAVRLVTGGEYETARGLSAPVQDWALRHALTQVAHGLLLLALIGGVGLALGAIVQRLRRTDAAPHADAALILLLWGGLPILAMSYTSSPVHTFYQLMGVPAGSLLAAWGLTALLRPHQWRAGALIAVALLLPYGALMSVNSARYAQQTAITPAAQDLYALPVGVGLRLGQQVRQALPPGGVVYAEAEGWIINSFAGALFPVNTDTRAPRFNYVPRDGAVYVDVLPYSQDLEAPGAPLPWGLESSQWLDLPDARLLVARLMPAADYPLSGTVTPVPSQQGLTLVDWQVSALSRGRYALYSVWRVDAVGVEVPQRSYGPFLHLFDAADARVQIIGGEVVPGPLWAVGDLHVHRLRFRPSVQPFRVEMGHYDGDNNANLIFLPPDGPTVALDLGLFGAGTP